MRLCVLTPAVFPTQEIADQKLWIFLASARKAKVYDLWTYGVGKTFPGYRAMCLDWQLERLKYFLPNSTDRDGTPSNFTHVLFTDAWDAMFTAPITEIIHKYEAMGSPPILCSAFHQLANESDMSKYEGCFDETIRNRYPNRGGYLAEIPAIIEAFERMLAQPNLTGDDCHSWYAGWKEGWFRPQLDSNCEIFQVSDGDCMPVTGPLVNRVFNSRSNSFPCILHLSGGYTDPETGKDERMIPWAKKLGII